MDTNLYWIHLPEHTNIETDGYVGVTRFPSRRFRVHKNSTENIHLRRAFEKYGNNIIFEIIYTGSEDICYYKEKELRPKIDIGWNQAIGGGKPPISGNVQLYVTFESCSKGGKIGGKKTASYPENKLFMKKAIETTAKNRKGKKWFYNEKTNQVALYFIGEEPNGWKKGFKRKDGTTNGGWDKKL